MDYEGYDFSGWATKNDIRCADGRIIRKDAFKSCNGLKVPIVWNHRHSDVSEVLGHGFLENRDEGVYVYGYLNKTAKAVDAKEQLQHGDITSLSIFANNLKEVKKEILHGVIKEVSLVIAGANPGAYITNVLAHSEDGEDFADSAIIFSGEEDISLSHSDEQKKEEPMDPESTKKENPKEDEKTVGDVIETMTDEQKQAMWFLIDEATKEKTVEVKDESKNENPEGGKTMKHNVFDGATNDNTKTLSHSDEVSILSLAKATSCGSLQDALAIYAENNEELAHSIDEIDTLFPEYKDIKPGAPELITRDQTWEGRVLAGIRKSPISRVRTRQNDVRSANIRGMGYKKGDKKVAIGNSKLLKRTTDPQTVLVKDALNRDDIIDITDFDVVEYQYGIMKMSLNEELAMAIMVGDGREEGDEYKISEEHIRSIWHDDDLYTIHTEIDLVAAKAKLQGTNTNACFGDEYVYAESVLESALYARENYKGSGSLEYYCTPHSLNRMLMARDMNGRRIYDSKADLAASLNVKDIITVEQFEGLTRTTATNKTKKLIGIFVNLDDYQSGATKGGEITRFQQFDIDFNQEKMLIETRLSGALSRVHSAIALEEDVTVAG